MLVAVAGVDLIAAERGELGVMAVEVMVLLVLKEALQLLGVQILEGAVAVQVKTVLVKLVVLES
jgi:hypothetical protein